MMGLTGLERILMISSAVWIQCTNLTDAQTDGQTDTGRQQRQRLCIASHGKNYLVDTKTILENSLEDTHWFYHKDRFVCQSEDTQNTGQSDISQCTNDDHRITASHTPVPNIHTCTCNSHSS